jgi:hypothetical protein
MLPRCLYVYGASTTLFLRLYRDSRRLRSRYAYFEHVQNKSSESVELPDHEDPAAIIRAYEDSTTFLLRSVTIGHVFGQFLIVVEAASMCERGVINSRHSLPLPKTSHWIGYRGHIIFLDVTFYWLIYMQGRCIYQPTTIAHLCHDHHTVEIVCTIIYSVSNFFLECITANIQSLSKTTKTISLSFDIFNNHSCLLQ